MSPLVTMDHNMLTVNSSCKENQTQTKQSTLSIFFARTGYVFPFIIKAGGPAAPVATEHKTGPLRLHGCLLTTPKHPCMAACTAYYAVKTV